MTFTNYPEINNFTTPTIQDILLLINNEEDGTKRARSWTATDLIQRYHFATMRDTKELYVYQNGYYQKKGEDVVASEVRRLWNYQCTAANIKEIIEAHIKPQTYTDREDFNSDLTRTCLKNGILNLDTGELEPFDPKHKFTFQLEVSYDPAATCPLTEKTLGEIVEDPIDIDTILESYAYCLYRSYPTAKIPVLLGGGRNGKSTILNLLKLFLGEENCRNMSIQQLEHSEYGKVYLFGRHANINPDITAQKINAQGAIKSLTGSDEIETNVKYHDHMHFHNFCKLIFGANELPQCDDTSDAWISRWIFIRFPHKFQADNICPHCHTQHTIIKDLHIELMKESSGLLNLVIKALQRLKANNWEFTLSPKAKLMESSYQSISDPVAGFLKECVVEAKDDKIGKTELYDAYRAYCGELGEPYRSSNHFSASVRTYMPDVQESRTVAKRFWVGITLKKEDIQIDLSGQDLSHDNPYGGISPANLS
jgi:putative DNA primase/helicase